MPGSPAAGIFEKIPAGSSVAIVGSSGSGKTTQEGTYDELVNREGLFRDLVLCQNAAQPA